MLVKSKPMPTIKRIPWPMTALFALMLVSSLLSEYRLISIGAWAASVITASYGLWLAHAFDWRHILKVFANTIRFILGASMAFELFAALIVRGPILPFFKNLKVTSCQARPTTGLRETCLTVSASKASWAMPTCWPTLP